MLLLSWLMVCLPYVNEDCQRTGTQIETTDDKSPETANDNPLSNTNEEKTENGLPFFSDYLHDAYALEHALTEISFFSKYHTSDIYLAYHPELIIPPPEA